MLEREAAYLSRLAVLSGFKNFTSESFGNPYWIMITVDEVILYVAKPVVEWGFNETRWHYKTNTGSEEM